MSCKFCVCLRKDVGLTGVGHFNNNFKVADDIRLLGAVPEEEEEREVPIDKHMAKAMEERLLKGIEQEMLRDKQAIIRSFMKDQSGALVITASSKLVAMAGGNVHEEIHISDCLCLLLEPPLKGQYLCGLHALSLPGW
jgi:hypothetical protein